jgi:nucleoside-diphosphate-sugar epimerase
LHRGAGVACFHSGRDWCDRLAHRARTRRSWAAKLSQFGATAIAGDISAPTHWAANLPRLDAVIHAACDFNTDMGAIDARLLDHLLPALAAQPNKPRFIYTGGCWLFGATGDEVATEATPFCALPAFAWMVPQLMRILQSPEADGIVIHPAMVYTPEAGVFRRFASEAVERDAIRVVASEQIRWPLVHSEDLAQLYALALERAPARSSYIGAAIEGIAIGRVARAFAKRFGTPRQAPQIVSSDANSAGSRNISIRKARSRGCRESTTAPHSGIRKAR